MNLGVQNLTQIIDVMLAVGALEVMVRLLQKRASMNYFPRCIRFDMLFLHSYFFYLLPNSGSNKIPKKLYWVSLPVITNEKCNEGYKGEVLDSMLCAGFESGGKAGCSGDSGGPLVCPNENNNPIITGVDSWGYKCGAAKYPGVYGRVTKFLSWIKENME